MRPLDSATVEVWLAWLDPRRLKPLRPRLEAWLSPTESQRLQRFRVEHARDEFLVGRGLLRGALAGYTGVAPQAWRFCISEHGKPAVQEPSIHRHLSFNLSHTRGLVALAVSRQRALGIDVEDSARRTQTPRIADRFFSEREAAALRALPRIKQPDRFFCIWTLKEAYMKARGLGLALPLGQFTFELPATGVQEQAIRIRFGAIDDDPQRWAFFHERASSRHHLALACRMRAGEQMSLRCCVVDLTRSIDGAQTQEWTELAPLVVGA